MNDPAFRVHVMQAAQRASAAGFPAFAAALADMLRIEDKRAANQIPAANLSTENHNQTCQPRSQNRPRA